jgi:hypothetical protein
MKVGRVLLTWLHEHIWFVSIGKVAKAIGEKVICGMLVFDVLARIPIIGRLWRNVLISEKAKPI